MGDEFPARLDRAEALIVEVVRHAIGPHLGERLPGQVDLAGCQIAHRDAEAVGADVAGFVGTRHLAKVFQRDAFLMELATRAVENGEVLHGARVTILQAAVSDAARLNLPAAAHCGQGIRRGPATLLQTIERMVAAAGGDQVGKLLDLKILGPLLDLHGRTIGYISTEKVRRKKRDRETRNSKPSPNQLRVPSYLSISSVRDSNLRCVSNFIYTRVEMDSNGISEFFFVFLKPFSESGCALADRWSIIRRKTIYIRKL